MVAVNRTMHTAHETRDLSVVIPTYNRGDALPRALESLACQDLDPERYEIVVVDNNSTDHTREVVEAFVGRTPRVRYVFEPRQGVASARNTGILTAVAPIIAFTDDDVRVSRDWATTILTVLAAHPEVACVGGKVLPNWQGPWPAWLTREHWAPLAILDYGEAPVHVNAERRLCLITANVAYRREIFDRLGMFAPHMFWLSDHEILVRLWHAGGKGLYWPQLTAIADIVPQRMRRRYHRRWHRRHGRFAALMHDEGFERTKVGSVFGVPAHVYRQAATHLAGWLAQTLRRNSAKAFSHEVGLWSCAGFFAARWREFLTQHDAPSRSPQPPST
jgi:glycosyltransferase involved in cell wall biosynthesis